MSITEPKKSIFVVDDEDINLDLMQGILDDYDVDCFTTGDSCLQKCQESPPDLVLLDVEMPEMDGLEVCRRLHAILPDCPVMFISSLISNEERLAGYTAGGYDYIAKPCDPLELLAKIELIMQQQEQYKILLERRKELSKAFMNVASGSGELGTLLQFSVDVFSVKSYQELAELVLSVLQNIGGLNAAVQVRGQQESVSRTSSGPCSPIEIEVLEMFKGKGRIYRFNDQVQINEANISVIIKSMPEDDMIAGRLIDNIPLLLKIASACAANLDFTDSSLGVGKTVRQACDELSATKVKLKVCMRNFTANIRDEIGQMENEVQHLALTEEQERNLFMSYSVTLDQTLDCAREVNNIGKSIGDTASELKNIL